MSQWSTSTSPSDLSNPHFGAITLLWSEQSSLFQQRILVSKCSFQQHQHLPLTEPTSALDSDKLLFAHPQLFSVWHPATGDPSLKLLQQLAWVEARHHHYEALKDKPSESLFQYSWLHKKPSFLSLSPSLPSPSNGAIKVMWIHSVADSERTEELLSSPVIQRPWRACRSPMASHPPSSSPPVRRLLSSVTRSINFMSADREKDLFTNVTPNLDT